MKYIAFFTALFLLFFSCKGTPKTNDELPEMFQYTEPEPDPFYEEDTEESIYIEISGIDEEEIDIEEEPEDIEVETDFDETTDIEIDTDFDETADMEEDEENIEEDTDIEEVEETEEETEVVEEEEIFKEDLTGIEEVDIEDEIIEILDTDAGEESVLSEELPAEITQIPEEEPVIEETPSVLEAQPPVQTEVQPQTQISAQTQTQPQEQPVQPQAQTPTPQTQPQAQMPVQPAQPPAQPIVPPAGPAEERIPFNQQESEFVRIEPVPPALSAVVPENEEVVFSRVVRATVGQTIEIPFRGTGWVYLGELASRRGIVYSSRRLDPEGQSFIFRAEEAGTYALKFFRQDFIRDYIVNDHVQIIVGEAPETGSGWFNPPIDRGRVIAQPRWPSAQEEAEIIRGGMRPGAVIPEDNRGDSAGQSEISGGSSQGSLQETNNLLPAASAVPPDSVPEESREILSPELPAQLPADVLLQRARETFNSGNVASAIALLDQYAQNYPSGTDELYWLYGQFYEANSPSRNILLSLDYYRRLMQEYPQSSRYNDARSRVAYLERFYINIQ